MASLPPDLVHEILSLLPVKALLKFKLVCKEWYNLIQSPGFIEYHYNRSLEMNNNVSLVTIQDSTLYHIHDLNSFTHFTKIELPCQFNYQVRGSCKGLLCLRSKQGLFLCNPATRVLKPVEVPKGINFDCSSTSLIGFGFDHISDDFKILMVLMHYQTWVYSLKSDSWRRIGSTPCGLFISDRHGGAVFNNNKLHWLCPNKQRIVCFDLHDEEFGEVPIMSYSQHLDIEWMHLVDFDGCLCLSFSTISRPIDWYAETHVWIMKEYNVKESWIQLFHLRDTELYPLTYNKYQNQIIFRESYERSICQYNLKGDNDIHYVDGFFPGNYITGKTITSCIDGLTPFLCGGKTQTAIINDKA
ncbi:F-box protein CPR1-like [Spinacia oleracea]|uniref:F-box protein CPR1-like n=1 Tax=Spinacia oleracea TaxID=3562 RepID=A0ABM3RFK7_SPIOL|nr:F-box protein CPR1-like [Spinacia oleracea]